MAVLFYINTSILLLLLIETLEQFSALFFSSINESTQSIPTTNCISFRFYMQPGLFTCWHSVMSLPVIFIARSVPSS